MTFSEIDISVKKSFIGKYTVLSEDYEKLTKHSYSTKSEVQRLREENRSLPRQIWSLQNKVSKLRTTQRELTEKCKPYLKALKIASKRSRSLSAIFLKNSKAKKYLLWTNSSSNNKNYERYENEMTKMIFKEMGSTYLWQGDYKLPYLSLPT